MAHCRMQKKFSEMSKKESGGRSIYILQAVVNEDDLFDGQRLSQQAQTGCRHFCAFYSLLIYHRILGLLYLNKYCAENSKLR